MTGLSGDGAGPRRRRPVPDVIAARADGIATIVPDDPGTIGTALSMSLDGFIAGSGEARQQLGSMTGLPPVRPPAGSAARPSAEFFDEGAGSRRLLDGLDASDIELEVVRVINAPGVTHLTYRVIK
jgi:hypothetical protein